MWYNYPSVYGPKTVFNDLPNGTDRKLVVLNRIIGHDCSSRSEAPQRWQARRPLASRVQKSRKNSLQNHYEKNFWYRNKTGCLFPFHKFLVLSPVQTVSNLFIKHKQGILMGNGFINRQSLIMFDHHIFLFCPGPSVYSLKCSLSAIF